MRFIQWLNHKTPLSFWVFVYGFSLLNLLLCNIPLLRYVFKNIELGSQASFLTFATVLVAQFFLTVLVMTGLGLIHTKLVKLTATLFFITNAIAFYFVNTYAVIITKEMMGNVFNTNSSEAGDLFSYSLLLYVFFLGLIPALLLQKFTIKPSKFLHKITLLIISLILVVVWALANSPSWLWIDKHAKYIVGSSMPWSYVINGISYQAKALRTRPQSLLPDLQFKNPQQEQLVVLVIGESARYDRFGLYGYHKDTTPLLAKENIVTMPDPISCTTYTTTGVACILSHEGNDTKVFANDEPLTSYLNRSGVPVIWRTKNWGEPEMKVTHYRLRDELRTLCTENCETQEYDELLLYGLENEIRNLSAKKALIVLHQSGSHGPSYNKKYPAQFEKFSPVCTSVQLENCTQAELDNAYDNTVLYTDYVLASLINTLRALKKPVVMLYISDHGESLGEDGFYLHGAPNMVAPKYQRQIPFIVWMSDEFKAQRHISNEQLIKHNQYSQSYIFHSVLGAFEASSPIYKPEFDIFK